MAKNLVWIEHRGQKVWLWIAAAFAAFYFGEAYLFWEPNPRLHGPPYTPLVYWGAFGLTILWLLRRQAKKDPAREPVSQVPRNLQSTILAMGITAAVIGIPLLVMRAGPDLMKQGHGNITLGHAVMLGMLFEAGIVIGGMSGNVGWLAAGLAWAASVFLVLLWPPLQDITIGIALVAGFALVGVLRWSIREKLGDGDMQHAALQS